MPIYEYRCEVCGEITEVDHPIGGRPPSVCSCEGCRGRLAKVFSPPAIIFKGLGFHHNDYNKQGPKDNGTE